MRPTPDDLALDYHSAETFHVQWLRQFFHNLPYLPNAQPLQDVTDCFAGKPALVISRGPSLDAAIPAIRALQNAVVLVAVGGAVRRLWEEGITPDFALFYDANGLQEQRCGIPSDVWARIAAVIHPSAQPGCFSAPARERFYFFTQYHQHLAAWLGRTLGRDIPFMGGGGTVSVIALRQALLMGCNPIVLVGQDLAFPNNQVYAGGIALQTDPYGQMNLNASDTLYAEPEAMTTVIGQNGEVLPALHAFPGFIRQLERIAAENAQSASPVQLYNASLGGAHIEGYPLTPLEAFENVWPNWKQGGHALDAISINRKADDTQAMAKLDVGLNALRSDLQEAAALCLTLESALPTTFDANALQEAIQRFSALLNREGNDLLAFIPALEMQRYRRQFKEALNLRQQGVHSVPDMQAEFILLMRRCRTLFESLTQEMDTLKITSSIF